MSKKLDNKLKATLVKIYVSNIFKGTGFFITPQGHILTAHHVIDDYAGKQIKVVSQRHGEFRNVTLEKHKTCRSADLIILKINFDKDQLVLDCVPLSINLPEERVKLLGIGYPRGTEQPETLKEAIFEGHFIRCCNPQTFEVNNAIQGAGQSGGLIYNLETHRVIGVAKAIHDGNVMKNTGLASRLDELFNHWEELDDITKNVAQQWDQFISKLNKTKENLSGFRNPPDLKEQVNISRLPKPSAKLVGRSEELHKLNKAIINSKINLVYICASGGTGKSALIFEWLRQIQPDYLGIEKVFAWSFYSQGSHDTQNSSTAFFEEALPFFGCPKEQMPKDNTMKGRLLIKLLNNQLFILILDGLEPLQHRANILDGEIKDTGILAFIDELFYYGLKVKQSLILISSRQPLKELEQWNQEKYVNLDLKTLNKKEGAILLKKLGVKGTTEGLEQEELEQTSEEWGGHALSLILLGKLLKTYFNGKIKYRDQLPKLWEEEKLGNHTQKILQYYGNVWQENSPEQTFLYLLGLFDRPMGLLEKEHLIDYADIANPLKKLNKDQWNELEQKLENAGLLIKSNAISRMEWDCHPLIREYAGEQFKKHHFSLFQQAHLILFEFYQQLPKKHHPDTSEELTPLYRAVIHGCLAGEYKKVLYEVYVERILRGANESYSLYKLGLYREDLSALAAFFPQNWSQPVQQSLSEADQAWLLAQASFCLMSLGRIAEAIQSIQATMNIYIKIKDWKGASITARSLVDSMLPLGQLTEATTAAQQAFDYAQQSEDLFEQVKSYVYLAAVLHCVGKLEESKQNFEQAEQLQKEYNSNMPQLYSTWGFQYFALLLDQATNTNEIEMVLKRGEYSLKLKTTTPLLDLSLNSLTLARAYFKLDELKKAEEYFNQAVDGIRKAGKTEFMPIFLLDRANLLIKINELEEAKRDLEEAKQLISRSGMKLYEVDYHLAMCRFFYLTKEKRSFDKHLSAAKTLIKSTGYHLRDKSVLELENLTF